MKKIFLIIFIMLFFLSNMPILYANDIKIDKALNDILLKFNPKFKIWNVSDYSQGMQDHANKVKRQPYILDLDVNDDGKPDLILDGHDDQNSILLCLISKNNDYYVEVIRKSSLENPTKLIVWNNGKKESGLNYYLWPHKDKHGFFITYPQQEDNNGKFISEGGVIDYEFSQGKFNESFLNL